jgi:hypothetical protein
MTSVGRPAGVDCGFCAFVSAPGAAASAPLSLLCSFSFARVNMSSMTRQFSAVSLSSFLDGVPVLLREGVRRRVERPKGPFSCVARRDPRSGLSHLV